MLSYLDHLLLHSKHNFRDLLRTFDTVQDFLCDIKPHRYNLFFFSERQHCHLLHPLRDVLNLVCLLLETYASIEKVFFDCMMKALMFKICTLFSKNGSNFCRSVEYFGRSDNDIV